MTKHISDETYITEDSACAEAVKRVQEEHWPGADLDKEVFGGVLIILRDKTGPDVEEARDRRFDLAIESYNMGDTKSMIALLQRTILVLQEGS